jgi:hypothetical protein
MATLGDNAVRTLPASSGIPSGALAGEYTIPLYTIPSIHTHTLKPQICYSFLYIAKELVHEMAEYLSRRFPQVYSVVRKPHVSDDFGWYGEGEIHRIRITPLGVTYDLALEDPMSVAGLL